MKNLIFLFILFLLPGMGFLSHAQKVPSKATMKAIKPVVPLSEVVSTRRMTTFNPVQHGFKFANTFVTSVDFAGINGLRLGGLCGGMVYSALDYYNKKMAVPAQDYLPANNTPLQSYIFNRQMNSLTSNADKWTELFVNPFGWRTQEFFNWGLQGTGGGRVQELKELIDKGVPAPLGLFQAGDGGVRPHHQVLAIGYDMGRYKGDLGEYKEDFKIFIYDPNYPNQVKTLRCDPASLSFYYENPTSNRWLTYFVDKKYAPSVPPAIPSAVLPADGLVRLLEVEITTGGDDLRGGNDNVHLIINFTDGRSETYENINRSARWIDNYCATVPITLRTPVTLNRIRSVSLKTTFGGGIGGDNWNVNGLLINAKEGGKGCQVYLNTGSPLVRFDGNNRPFEAVFRY